MTPKLSAVVLAHNEERHLPDCLATLHWVDELVVVDSFSTDRTAQIAGEAGARVEQRPFTHFGDQRQAALEMARGEWVLFVDADERVPPALADEIRTVLARGGPEVGWWIPRRNYFWGREVRATGWSPDHQLRLLRRDAARYDITQHVHEVATLDGPAGYLNEPMLHINYDSWGEFWEKQRRYAGHEGRKLAEQGLRWKPRNMILQPLRAFARRFIRWRGWRDGLFGFILSLAMAWWEAVAYWDLHRLERLTPENGEEPPMHIDHIVISVDDLEAAVARYRRMGFTVSRGGEHPAFGSRNALIPLADDSYLELITFHDERPLDQSAAMRRFARWRARAGLVDWVVATDRIDETVARLQGAGQAWSDPERGHRMRPDGLEVAWRSAFPADPTLPFLITDLTPRDYRVPTAAAREHENGVRGISRLVIATRTLGDAAERYASLLGEGGRACEVDLPASEARCWQVAGVTVVLAAPAGEDSPLHGVPDGPYDLTLHGDRSREFALEESGGVRLRVESRE
mgnify:CR=1 FL=1